MDVSTLIYEYQKHNPNGHYFDKETLKFFGETRSRMYVLKNKTIVKDIDGTEHTCWVLRAMQTKNPDGPKNHYSYFDAETFDYIPDPTPVQQ